MISLLLPERFSLKKKLPNKELNLLFFSKGCQTIHSFSKCEVSGFQGKQEKETQKIRGKRD